MPTNIGANSDNQPFGSGTGAGASPQYTVQPGDTLSFIAQDLHITLADLLCANPSIRNANLIYPGQKILLPATHRQAHATAGNRSAQNRIPLPTMLGPALGGYNSGSGKAKVAPKQSSAPPWMQIAEDELKFWEKGLGHSRYLKYVRETGGCSGSWCSIFVNWVMQQAGYTGTQNWLAASWMKWGIALKVPRHGAIVVLQDEHPSNPYPHVAFLRAAHGSWNLELLGGNQGGGLGAVTASNRSFHEQTRDGRISFNYRWPPH
jgi:uncharacterized protein (TIGR02594 family)